MYIISSSSPTTIEVVGATTTSSSERSTGVSTGAAVGIGVGVGVGVLGIISLFGAVYFARRRRNKAQGVAPPPVPIDGGPVFQTAGHWAGAKQELEGSNVVAELPGHPM